MRPSTLAVLLLLLPLSGGLPACAGPADGPAAPRSDPGSSDHRQLTLAAYRAQLAAAEAGLRLHEARTAADWLAETPPALRGWEWRWLTSRTDASARSLRAHPGAVAYGLRRSADGELLLRWRPHPTPVYDVAFVEDTLATLGHDDRIHLHRAAAPSRIGGVATTPSGWVWRGRSRSW